MQIKLLFFFLTLNLTVFAQIQVEYYENGSSKYQFIASDSLSVLKNLQKQQLRAISEGYFFVGIDSVIQANETSWSAYISKGSKLSNKAKINGNKVRNIIKYLEQKLSDLEENGYPFASVKLDSFRLNNNDLEAKITLNKSDLIRYDSIYFLTKIKTNKSFVMNQLGFLYDRIYNEKNYQNISKKINQISFLELQAPAEVIFQGGMATVYLNLKEKKAASFEGVLGLQPNGNQETNLVGALDLQTDNLFRSGKKLRFHWETFANQSQELKLNYEHPFLFNLSVSPSFNFEILKQDSTFLTQNLGVGFSFYPLPNLKMTLGYKNENGTILSTDKTMILSNDFLDFRKNLYEIHLSNNQYNRSNWTLANRFFWSADCSIGNRTIQRNTNLNKSYYDTLKLTSLFPKIDVSLRYDWKIGKIIMLHQTLRGGWLGSNNLLKNELYRVGGLKSLRGFLEKELYADYFCLSRAELRAFFEEESFFYLFYDQSLVHRMDVDFPLGVGLGLALDTSVGQFNFALAAGKNTNQPLFDSGIKAHFGYVSIF